MFLYGSYIQIGNVKLKHLLMSVIIQSHLVLRIWNFVKQLLKLTLTPFSTL